jgi:DNA invertase Pin-like site-specific DNA recombinase
VPRFLVTLCRNTIEVPGQRALGFRLRAVRREKKSQVPDAMLCFLDATYKLDRLGRSITHLCLLTDEMTRLGIPLICSSQGIDTSADNPCAKFQIDILKAVCEFERNLIRDRVNVGIAAARMRGVRLGRPATLGKRAGEVMALKKRGLGVRAIARELSMPVSSVHSVLKSSTEVNTRRSARQKVSRQTAISSTGN